MEFSWGKKKFNLLVSLDDEKIFAQLFEGERLLGSKYFALGNIERECQHCKEIIFIGDSFSIRVNNYLPKDKIILLKFNTVCECGVCSDFYSSFSMDIIPMMSV